MTLLYHIKQIGFTLPQVCTVIQNVDHRRQKYMFRALVTCVSLFLFSPHFYIFLLSFTEQRHNNMEYICQTLLCKKQNKTKQNKKKSLFQFSLLIFSCFSTHSCLIFSLSNLSISCLKRIPKIYLLITQCSVHL